EKSPWIHAFKGSALARVLAAAPELKELLKFQQDLQEHLGIDWRTIRDDVLGDAVALAYQPGPPGKPQEEMGALLVHASRPEALGRLLDSLNRAQRSSGELKGLHTREYRGTKYFQRVGPKETHYYLLDGPFFVYTGSEALLRQVIDQHISTGR